MKSTRRSFLVALAAVVTVPLAALGFKSQKKWRVVKEQPLSIFEQCAPRIVGVSSSCDRSLTRANVQRFSPKMLEDLTKEADDLYCLRDGEKKHWIHSSFFKEKPKLLSTVG